MSDPDLSRVRHLPRPVLCFALWREMANEKSAAPKNLRAAEAAMAALPAEDAAALLEFRKATWPWVSECVKESAWGVTPEKEVRARLVKELPFLDDWTLDVLWNVAFTSWSM